MQASLGMIKQQIETESINLAREEAEFGRKNAFKKSQTNVFSLATTKI